MASDDDIIIIRRSTDPRRPGRQFVSIETQNAEGTTSEPVIETSDPPTFLERWAIAGKIRALLK